MKFNKEGWLIECNIPFIIHPIPLTNKSSRPGRKINATTITVHNPASKATAKQLSEYVDRTKEYKSWTFTIGQNLILQELSIYEESYHAGDGALGSGNMTSLSCEVRETASAEETAIKFLNQITKELKINVVPHQIWTGKYCPRLILPHWDEFVKNINGSMTIIQKQTILKEQGYYKDVIDGNYGPNSIKAFNAFAEDQLKIISNINIDNPIDKEVSIIKEQLQEIEEKFKRR